MGFFEKLNKVIIKIQDWVKDTPTGLLLSRDVVLKEKIKTILTKYAIYDEVNVADYTFNGFGLLAVEYVGKEENLEDFTIVLKKTVFDYLRLSYLDFTKVKIDTKKIEENMYIVNIYYSFNRKTLENFELYYNKLSNYKKQEVLEQEVVKDDELEEEFKEWKIE